MQKWLLTDTGLSGFFYGRYSGAAGTAQTKAAEAKYELDRKIFADLKLRSWDVRNSDYWQRYIKDVTRGRVEVVTELDLDPKSPPPSPLQFFLIKDGAEGFLPPKTLRVKSSDPSPSDEVVFDQDSSAVVMWNVLDKKAVPYDASNALVITDAVGTVVAYFQLLVMKGREDYLDLGEDPTSKAGKALEKARKERESAGLEKDPRARDVRGKGWDGRRVKMATPSAYDYAGLSVEDGDDYHSDIHGFLGTHGCIQVCPYVHERRVDPRRKESSPSFDVSRIRNEFAPTYMPHWNQFLEADSNGRKAKNPDHPANPLWLGIIRLVGF